MTAPRLDFALRFVDGRGVLGLPTQTLFDLVGVERLELTVPNLRFPFDASGGTARFQSRRCEFGAAELRVDGARLQAWLDGRTRFGRLGVMQLKARLVPGRIELSARTRIGDNEAAVTARVTVEAAGGQRLRARISDVRLYGYLPAPAPLIGLGLALGLGAEPDAAPSALALRGVGELECNPLELLLWRALPPAGWRLPRYGDAALVEARVDEGAIHLRYDVTTVELAAPASDEATRAAEGLLARGDLLGAVEAYGRLARATDGPEAAEQQLAILAAMPARWPEAETMGARLVAEYPDRPQPLCALGAIEAERGLYATAAARYVKLAELAEARGERDDARQAALRAGELYARVSAREAIPWLEKTLASARDDVRAATLLADAYASDGRWQELLRLERWRLTQTSDPALEAELRGRIARVWLDHLDDPVRARDELERALRSDKSDANLWELYARALEAMGDHKRAREALSQAAARLDGARRAALELRAATLADAAGETDVALGHARAALAAVPTHQAALERTAALLARLGRLDDAVAAYQDAIDRAEEAHDDVARAGLLVALARLAREALHDRHGARAYVERALGIASSTAALTLAAELASEDGRLDDLERLLEQLADAGDRQARLRQAEVLSELGRFAEAAAAAEAVTSSFPARAYALSAHAYAALGRPGELRHALEQLATVGGEPAARIKLAELRCADGDLEGARALLDEALRSGALDAADERRAVELQSDVLMRLGDDAAVEALLGRLAELRDDTQGRARALAAQGAARARLGRLADALESYRAALRLSGADDDAQARAGLGEAAFALKLWDEARAALEPLFARGVQPRVERALRLGEIAERQGRPEEAVPFYEAALAAGAHAADAVRAHNALGGIFRSRGDSAAEAEALIRAADDASTNEPDTVRAGRLVTAADLLRRRSGRRDEAVACYERALALDGLQIVALDALEALASEAGDVERVAQVLGRKVAATAKRPAEQKAILGRLAALQADLGRPDAARAAWARALALDGGFRPALAWLAADAHARGASDEELAALGTLVTLPADPAEPDETPARWARLAELHQANGRSDEAERAARRALELHPRERVALAVLDAVLEQRGDPRELAKILAVRAEVETDFDAIVELLFRRAALLEGGGEARAAMQAYEQLIALRPSSAAAWNRLAALLRDAGEWAPLAQLLTRLAERHAADGRRTEAEALYIDIAHLAHDRLGDAERARAVLLKALEVEPRSRVALTSLLALARGRGDVAEEDSLLGRLCELYDDGAARALAVAERARARHARGDLDGALTLLRELVPSTSPDAALKLRVEIEESRGMLTEAAAALEELRARAAAARDDAAERWATRRLLRVAAAQRSGASEELARRALELDPDDREAATLLAEVERSRGNPSAQLVALERLLRIARRTFEGPEREAELGIAIAGVLADSGDLDGALVRLREVLEVAPDAGAVHRAYGGLLARRAQWREAARALARAAELGALDGHGWVQLGEAYEGLGDGERALAAFQRAGDAAPAKKRAEAAFRAGRIPEARAAAIEALAAQPRDREALGWALHGLSPAAVLAVADELSPRLGDADAGWLFATVARDLAAVGPDEARLALERAAALAPTAEVLVALADQMRGSAAAERYEAALALDPGSVDAALGLAQQGDPYAAARALQTSWEHASDERQRARLSAARAVLLRDRLGDVAGARAAIDRALAECQPFPELAPLRAELLRSQASLARASGESRAAETALERLRAEGAADATDLRHLAELYAERGAHDAVVELLAPLTGSSEALERALEATGRLDELATRLSDEGARKPPSEARTMYLRAAQLAADRLDDPKRAALLLERALPLGPADAEVWARLGRLYLGPLGDPDRGARCLARAYAADRDRTDVLLPLGDFHHDAGELDPASDYYREALARFAVPADEAGRVHLRLAEHAHERGDAEAEEQSLLQAAQLGGGDDDAWPRLAALYRARGDGTRLAEVLLRQAAQRHGMVRAALLREASPHLPPDEATRIDEQILLLDPSDEAARDRVLSRVRATGDTAALIERLDRELPRASPERQASYARELGRLAQRVGDDARAERAWTTALLAAPGLEAARALWELLSRSDRRAQAAARFEAAAEDPRLDVNDRGELMRLAGEAYLSPGADSARALAFVERARNAGLPLPLDPAAFRQLLRAERRFLDLVVALDAAATEARLPAERLALELEATEALERDLGHHGDAARRYAALFDRQPDNRELAARARIAYAAAGEPIYALALVDREIKLVAAKPSSSAVQAEQAQLKIVRGELLLQAGADAEAEAEFLHALITTPRVGRAHAALADVYKKRGDLAGALEHLIAAADAPDLEPMRAAACAVDAADVLLVEGDSATAERLYELAAALDPADRRPVDALARLAAARGDHERHADLLGRAAALTADRRERARLALSRARLFHHELKRELDAYRAYKEAVACDPNLREAARALREMAEARGAWALAAEQRYRELALTTDALERARLHIELAHLLEDKILDAAAALRNFEQAAELVLDAGAAPDHAPWAELVRLYADAQRWRDAALSAERLAATLIGSEHAAGRAEALSRAGELHERSGDHERARQRLAEAAAIGGEAGRKADDSLLRLAEDDDDPEELRRRIEERLAVEPEGELRLELLRRLLVLAARLDDVAEIDVRSQEILLRAPADAEAFVQRKHLLTARGDWLGVAQLLRARAAAVPADESAEQAELRFEAGRLAEGELYDVATAANDYEAALGADPEHVAALDALADLSYRTRHLSRARALYAELGERPSLLGADEVWRRRAELAEESGDIDEARAFYAEAVRHNPSNLSAHQSLARLALARGDDLTAYHALRAILDLLPLDAVERITELRRHLGELALKIGEREAARNYLELVVAQLPMESRALELLARIYIDQQAWQEASEALGRLSRLVREASERAELLYRRGEVLRLGLGDLESANDSYLKAADLHPTHVPTLRRLVGYYYSEGDFAALKDLTRDLEQLGQPLEEAAIEAGLGLALGGDEARGTVVVAVARPTALRLAELLAAARLTSLAQLDPALRASARALGPDGRATLQSALEALVADPLRASPAGARLALGRLHDAAGDTGRARVHYAVGAFVEPTGVAAARLRELGPAEPYQVAPEELVHPRALGPLRDALVALAPLCLGLPPSEIDADPAPAWTDKLCAIAERASGVAQIEAAVVVDGADAAWAEPTRPPRLLLARRALADDSVARFATARAMHALVAGVPLVQGRTADDVAALLWAAATMALPDLRRPQRSMAFVAFMRAWQTELASLPLDPQALAEPVRARLEVVLAAAVADAHAAASAADYTRAERLTADRVALAITGDLRAALAALAPATAATPAERAAALAVSPLSDLLAFALTIT